MSFEAATSPMNPASQSLILQRDDDCDAPFSVACSSSTSLALYPSLYVVVVGALGAYHLRSPPTR